MDYSVIIEIPKGSDRRIHMSDDGGGFKDFGPIKERIPVNNGVMPVDYGYIDGLKNMVEKDDVDALIFSNKKLDTGDKMVASVIGIMFREDDDHKILMTAEDYSLKNFDELPKNEQELIKNYFGYNKKISLGNREEALVYINNCKNSSNIVH